MWSIFKKNKSVDFEGFSWLAQDIHSHLLPGIDDGSPDVETSLKLLRNLSAAGIKKFICTPHVIGDLFRNTPETINKALGVLQNAIKEEGLDVEISAAAEYMLDDYFISLMNKKEPLLTLKENYLLTEFSYYSTPTNADEILFELLTNNYQPILAHPERYPYYHKDFSNYASLKEKGFLLQVNLLSIMGYYGKVVAKAAHYMLANNLVSFVGSDLHHEKHLAALTSPASIKIFEKYLGNKIYNQF